MQPGAETEVVVGVVAVLRQEIPVAFRPLLHQEEPVLAPVAYCLCQGHQRQLARTEEDGIRGIAPAILHVHARLHCFDGVPYPANWRRPDRRMRSSHRLQRQLVGLAVSRPCTARAATAAATRHDRSTLPQAVGGRRSRRNFSEIFGVSEAYIAKQIPAAVQKRRIQRRFRSMFQSYFLGWSGSPCIFSDLAQPFPDLARSLP